MGRGFKNMIWSDEAWSVDPWFEFRGSVVVYLQKSLVRSRPWEFCLISSRYWLVNFLAMSNFFLNALFSLAERIFEILKERIELTKVQFFKIVKKRNEWNGKILERRNSRTIELGITSCFGYVTVKSTIWLFPNFFPKIAKILSNDIFVIVNLVSKLIWTRKY